ncbi:hypothetical protein GA0061100_11086 [Rhizobium hainanense]|uniref:Uncharacterized protein n=1 Tax=Rhizobium hainanense TaxID=52131 RepID=A0A1C3W271_9HYPH|nr:hypothetical protein GA0061100_11086 [Rhizobium hainanense]
MAIALQWMIHCKLPNTHLVMHGSSLVPEELQEIINRYGSQMTPAMAAPTKLCKERFEQFDTACHALRIQPFSVAEMAKRYKSGSLDPVLS